MPNNKAQGTLYESFAMYHQDGTLMCYCSEKKAQWYISRGLASWVNDIHDNKDNKQPKNHSFQLNFTPAGHGKSEKPFYVQPAENRCVVCGRTSDLNKHHVVPYVFRSRFPLRYKESNHHDVLATCIDCHEAYETHATQYKKNLAQEVGVSINGAMTQEERDNRRINSARNFVARYDNNELLLANGEKIPVPEEKLLEMRKVADEPLKEHVKGSAWADAIMRDVMQKDGLHEFIKKWRKHFIQYAKPQFLPKYWSVDNPLEVVREGR